MPPKNLSLKKKLQSGQTSITNFYKVVSEKECITDSGKFHSGFGQPCGTKRKATSPIGPKHIKLCSKNLETAVIEIIESPTQSPLHNVENLCDSNMFKTQYVDECLDSEIRCEQISPQFLLRRSPRGHKSSIHPAKATTTPKRKTPVTNESSKTKRNIMGQMNNGSSSRSISDQTVEKALNEIYEEVNFESKENMPVASVKHSPQKIIQVPLTKTSSYTTTTTPEKFITSTTVTHMPDVADENAHHSCKSPNIGHIEDNVENLQYLSGDICGTPKKSPMKTYGVVAKTLQISIEKNISADKMSPPKCGNNSSKTAFSPNTPVNSAPIEMKDISQLYTETVSFSPLNSITSTGNSFFGTCSPKTCTSAEVQEDSKENLSLKGVTDKSISDITPSKNEIILSKMCKNSSDGSHAIENHHDTSVCKSPISINANFNGMEISQLDINPNEHIGTDNYKKSTTKECEVFKDNTEKSCESGTVPADNHVTRTHTTMVEKVIANKQFGTNIIENMKKKDRNGCLQDEKIQNIDSVFDDDWIMEDIDEDIEDLDLSTFQRCDITSIEANHNGSSVLKLRSSSGKKATCIIEGFWTSLRLSVGDTVSVLATRSDQAWRVTSRGGLLVHRPDLLLSSTAVVGAVFCTRRAVLQERFRGIDGGNKAMVIGILVHELVQSALRQRLSGAACVQRACAALLSSSRSARLLYEADVTYAQAQHELDAFLPQIVRFVRETVLDPSSGRKPTTKPDDWNGSIEKVVDIEENIISPQLGLKGKIDVTLQVNIHDRNDLSDLVPLELKTGRASVSAEHRGQLILYMMMMSLQDATKPVSRGLLLYLKEIVTLKVVTSGYPEQSGLIMLRNQLAQYLAPKTRQRQRTKRPDTLTEVEAANDVELDSGKASTDDSQSTSTIKALSGNSDEQNVEEKLEDIEECGISLPEPIDHHSCKRCPYLTLCSVFQWHTKSVQLPESHQLSLLRSEALGHLCEAHVEYFLKWTGLLLLEDLDKSSKYPLHHIWTVPPNERQREGRCLCDLEIAQVTPASDRFLHTFVRPATAHESSAKGRNGISVGEYVLVSTNSKVWIAAGCVTEISDDFVSVTLERDLRERNGAATRYHIDKYESQNQLGFNLANLGALMDNTDAADRLRRLIIEREPPTFSAHLPRSVGRLGVKLLKPLNLLQQRAVLKALAADHYTLIHGMPGTGKTQTVSVLIQFLVALGHKVLVTAHTHSAVDNVLSRLPAEMKILRVGSSARVSARLARCTEDALTKHCTTPEQLGHVYETADVVGVTCLGAGHPLLSKHQFDTCIVDESTQVLQCTALRPLLAARRFVLLGDPHQLPPLVHSDQARRLGLEECLFSRLRAASAEATMSLSAQYRMNERVTALANLLTYEGRLTCATQHVKQACLKPQEEHIQDQYISFPWLKDCISGQMNKSVLLLDTGCTTKWRTGEEERGKTANEAETLIVIAVVRSLVLAGISTEDIGVIAPYRDQVSLLKSSIDNLLSALSPELPRSTGKTETINAEAVSPVEVNTVDQYQGRDKSVIVYSCCKTWDREKGDFLIKDGEILEDKRRLTVAITRAKHKLLMVGDVDCLQHYSTFSKLFQCLKQLDPDGLVFGKVSDVHYDLLKDRFAKFLM